jgi:hypothetical protein
MHLWRNATTTFMMTHQSIGQRLPAGADAEDGVVERGKRETTRGVERPNHRKTGHGEAVCIVRGKQTAHRNGHGDRLADVTRRPVELLTSGVPPVVGLGGNVRVCIGDAGELLVKRLDRQRDDLATERGVEAGGITSAVDDPRFRLPDA